MFNIFWQTLLFSVVLCWPYYQAFADKPAVSFVKLVQSKKGWNVHVTVRHKDSGWDHYADAWRLVDLDGNEIARRVLRHPHIKEQPFTRSLKSVDIGKNKIFFVEAHDKVHGWGERIEIDLTQTNSALFEIVR